MLTAPFTIEEIKEVVWEYDGNKSPYSDGFNFNFIQNFWEIISPEILKFFNEFHSSARLPKAVSASFMTLIPKNSNPRRLSEYRPISLIGCLYKMLAKLLAGRLKSMPSSVISDCQSAFIPKRQMLDGVVVVNEILGLGKRKKQSCLVLKADFEKAYDLVS